MNMNRPQPYFANSPVCPRAVHAYNKFSAIEGWTEDQDPELLPQLRRRAAERTPSNITFEEYLRRQAETQQRFAALHKVSTTPPPSTLNQKSDPTNVFAHHRDGLTIPRPLPSPPGLSGLAGHYLPPRWAQQSNQTWPSSSDENTAYTHGQRGSFSRAVGTSLWGGEKENYCKGVPTKVNREERRSFPLPSDAIPQTNTNAASIPSYSFAVGTGSRSGGYKGMSAFQKCGSEVRAQEKVVMEKMSFPGAFTEETVSFCGGTGMDALGLSEGAGGHLADIMHVENAGANRHADYGADWLTHTGASPHPVYTLSSNPTSSLDGPQDNRFYWPVGELLYPQGSDAQLMGVGPPWLSVDTDLEGDPSGPFDSPFEESVGSILLESEVMAVVQRYNAATGVPGGWVNDGP
ncbi:hypothetical protein C8Q74DRAFT_1248667 [Fomes fomentarius]|nr:hypothetical protein C8Q74DRAFT_1248667 [Fomes fomentarius]